MERRRGQARTYSQTRPPELGAERRFVVRVPEMRAALSGGGESMAWGGRPIVYNTWTTICDYWYGDFEEQIAAGAAAESLAADDVRALFNHDPSLVLGRSRGQAGDTLILSEDMTGVNAEGTLPDTVTGRDVATLLRRGDVSGMSFAFEVLAEKWGDRPDGMWLRTITKIRMYDVSIVTYPAYEETDAAMRSALLRGLPSLRSGRRNSAADEEILGAAIESNRTTADELETLLEAEQAEPAEAESARAADLRTNQAARHRAFAAMYGL